MGKWWFIKKIALGGVWLLYGLDICLAGVGIEVTPSTFDTGTGGVVDVKSWTAATPVGGGAFTVKNVGDTAGALKIRATNTANWSLGAVPGLNTFSLQWGQTVITGSEPGWKSISMTANPMFNLVGGVSSNLDLRFRSPSSIDPNTTATQNSVVTIKIEPAFGAPNYTFLKTFGSRGFGGPGGKFFEPRGAAVDTSGNIYVADTSNNRIQKFTSNGTFTTMFGSQGTADGQFKSPFDIAVNASGDIYVTEHQNNRVQKFEPGNLNKRPSTITASDGTVYGVLKWGTFGSADGQFSGPTGVAVDALGNVYVTQHHDIQKFTSEGVFIRKWGSFGTGDGQFDNATGIAIDVSGNVYVADLVNHRIQMFTSEGVFIRKWGSFGLATGHFSSPIGVAVDAIGNVYVTEGGNSRVQVFTSGGSGFITKFGSSGNLEGQFSTPYGIAVDASGNVYVVERGNHRVQVFAPQF